MYEMKYKKILSNSFRCDKNFYAEMFSKSSRCKKQGTFSY